MYVLWAKSMMTSFEPMPKPPTVPVEPFIGQWERERKKVEKDIAKNTSVNPWKLSFQPFFSKSGSSSGSAVSWSSGSAAKKHKSTDGLALTLI